MTDRTFAVAFDGCHKHYICETDADVEEATQAHYIVRQMTASELLDSYTGSCGLQFVNTWQLKPVVTQCANKRNAKKAINAFYRSHD